MNARSIRTTCKKEIFINPRNSCMMNFIKNTVHCFYLNYLDAVKVKLELLFYKWNSRTVPSELELSNF